MRVEEFDYELPEELIAQTPLEVRSHSRLLVVDPVAKSMEHRHFQDIAEYLVPGDVLVMNNSKVIPARLFGLKEGTGAKVELLLLKPVSETEWLALAKPAKRLSEGTAIIFSENARGIVTSELDEGIRQIRFELQETMEAFLDKVGVMPLPPYIHAPLREKERYQTVYAKHTGSVAAPTAGLHFTESLLDVLREKGVEIHFVTLHVGLGTFRPVQAEDVEAHVMHSEHYVVDEGTADAINAAKASGRRVIAVGTTALRTLESATRDGVLVPGVGDTDIFIYPGYQFRMIDALITNFHLPKSTLLMLVATLMGLEFTKQVYETAVQQRYRFFSFGDAMFITRRCPS